MNNIEVFLGVIDQTIYDLTKDFLKAIKIQLRMKSLEEMKSLKKGIEKKCVGNCKKRFLRDKINDKEKIKVAVNKEIYRAVMQSGTNVGSNQELENKTKRS